MMEKYGVWCVSSAGWCWLCPKIQTEKSVDGIYGSYKQASQELKSFTKEYPDHKYIIARHNETCNGAIGIVSNCCEPIFVQDEK